MTKMQTIASALLLLLCAGAPAGAAAQVAPPVRKVPVAASAEAPQIPEDEVAVTQVPAAALQAPAAAAQAPVAAGRSAQNYLTALAAAGSSEDQALDRGLITAMSRLLAAGRCTEAASLATRSDRAPLAARARQLCGGK